LPVKVTSLIQEHNAIGWSQLFNGRLSSQQVVEWYTGCRVQTSSPSTRSSTKTNRNEMASKIYSLGLGTLGCPLDRSEQAMTWPRPDHPHSSITQGGTTPTYYNIPTAQLNGAPCRSFTSRISRGSRPAFVVTTRNWIVTHSTLFKTSVRRVKTRVSQGVWSITTYFQPRKGG
jgi:hypothetical protein